MLFRSLGNSAGIGGGVGLVETASSLMECQGWCYQCNVCISSRLATKRPQIPKSQQQQSEVLDADGSGGRASRGLVVEDSLALARYERTSEPHLRSVTSKKHTNETMTMKAARTSALDFASIRMASTSLCRRYPTNQHCSCSTTPDEIEGRTQDKPVKHTRNTVGGLAV
jgi:hypothetical protein